MSDTTVFATLNHVSCYLCGVLFGLEAGHMAHLYLCGVLFGLEAGHMAHLRKSHAGFYCPNGHEQFYLQQTDAEMLRDQLTRGRAAHDQTRASRDAAWKQTETLERSARAIRGHLTRVRKRVAAGVCPCCNRTFAQLAQHMKSKHPLYPTLDLSGAKP